MESLALLADALSLTIASPFLALSTTVNIEHEHEASIHDSIASAPPRPPTSSFSKRAALLVGALLIFISTVAPATLEQLHSNMPTWIFELLTAVLFIWCLNVGFAAMWEGSRVGSSTAASYRKIIPVVTHGDTIKGTVVLTAPPGQTRVIGGLSISLHCSKCFVPKPVLSGAASKALESVGGTPELRYARLVESEALELLPPRRYELTGETTVPFVMPTGLLPPLESFEAANGAGVWHWIEVRVAAVGVRGWVQRRRDAYDDFKKHALASQAQLGVPGLSATPDHAYLHVPSTRAAAVERVQMQRISASSPPAEEAPVESLSVCGVGAEANLTMCDGATAVLSAGAALRCRLRLKGGIHLSRVELQLATRIDDTPPIPICSCVVWSRVRATPHETHARSNSPTPYTDSHC